jgi:hypothetical protein
VGRNQKKKIKENGIQNVLTELEETPLQWSGIQKE